MWTSHRNVCEKVALCRSPCSTGTCGYCVQAWKFPPWLLAYQKKLPLSVVKIFHSSQWDWLCCTFHSVSPQVVLESKATFTLQALFSTGLLLRLNLSVLIHFHNYTWPVSNFNKSMSVFEMACMRTLICFFFASVSPTKNICKTTHGIKSKKIGVLVVNTCIAFCSRGGKQLTSCSPSPLLFCCVAMF